MNASLAVLVPARSSFLHRFRGALRLVALVASVAVADVLFYFQTWGGPVFALFFALVGVAALLVNPLRDDGRRRLVAGLLAVAALAAMLADGGVLSVFVAWAGCAAAVLLVVAVPLPWDVMVARIGRLPFVGWWRLPCDLLAVRRAARRGRRHAMGQRFVPSDWVMPGVLSVIFSTLFLAANPVLELWFVRLDPRHVFAEVGWGHFVFWLVAAAFVWPLLRLGRSARPARTASVRIPLKVFRPGEVIRSLVACNLVFAMQTATDLGYLWAGFGLPAGMSHAEYAHRGAYPLMGAAMVAGGLVLLALRDGDAERVPVLRRLLLAFVAQGLMLVVSSILRLELYVAAYSMTLWRLAAFVWMGLVAFGFATILLRLLRGWSNRRLWTVNATAAAFVLWGWCFVDDVDLVARFNIGHCREVTGSGPELDRQYLRSLGPAILPALDARRDVLAARIAPTAILEPRSGSRRYEFLGEWREDIARDHRFRTRGWRTWSFKDWRLDRYLATMPAWPPHPTVE